MISPITYMNNTRDCLAVLSKSIYDDKVCKNYQMEYEFEFEFVFQLDRFFFPDFRALCNIRESE